MESRRADVPRPKRGERQGLPTGLFPRNRGPRGSPTPPGGSGHPRVAVEGAWQWQLRYACCLPDAARVPACLAWRAALGCGASGATLAPASLGAAPAAKRAPRDGARRAPPPSDRTCPMEPPVTRLCRPRHEATSSPIGPRAPGVPLDPSAAAPRKPEARSSMRRRAFHPPGPSAADHLIVTQWGSTHPLSACPPPSCPMRVAPSLPQPAATLESVTPSSI